MKTLQERIEYFQFTSEENVKFRFKANKIRGYVEIEVGVIPPDRDRHIVAMSTTEPFHNDEDLARLILSTLREWDDCDGYDLLSEEDAGQEYTYWED